MQTLMLPLLLFGIALLQADAAPLLTQPTCYKSVLGYQCSLQMCRDITLHWSLGDQAPDGSTPCTYNTTSAVATDTATDASDANATLMHIALTSNLKGYVSIAFPRIPLRMWPADAVIGWLNPDAPAIAAYNLQGERVSKILEDSTVALLNTAGVTGVNGSGTGDGVTICFTRTVGSAGAAGSTLKLDGMAVNVAADRDPGLSQHDQVCARRVSFLAVPAPAGTQQAQPGGNWAPNGQNDDISDGEAEEQQKRAHGALMVIAWAVLVPAGILSSRHRALFRDTATTKRWFYAHTGFQFSAMLLTTISLYVIINTAGFDINEWTGLLRAHGGVGITIIVLLLVHLLVAAARPHPGAPRRPAWNVLHRVLAGSLCFLAFINLMTGPKLFERGQGEGGAGPFYAATFIMLVLFALLALGLEWWRRRTGSTLHGGAGAHRAPTYFSGSSSTASVEERYSVMPNGLGRVGGDAAPFAVPAQRNGGPAAGEREGLQMQMLPVSVQRSDVI